MSAMRIGQLAKHCNISTETLRYYENAGLLPKPGRQANGYRDYPENTIQRIQFIKHAKAVGFTLREIQDLLSIHVEKDRHTCKEVKNLTRQKLKEIDRKLAQLQSIRHALSIIHERCCGGSEPASQCSILTALEANHPTTCPKENHHD